MMRYLLPVILLATPTVAQDTKQTPEGAQRLLSILAEQGSLQLFYHYQHWPRFTLIYRATAATSESVCLTRLDARPESIGIPLKATVTGPSAEFNSALRSLAPAYTHVPPPAAINWAKVTSVTIGGWAATVDRSDELTVWIAEPDGGTALRVADGAMVKRVHYAATFLKEHCDKTAETGF